MEVLYHFPCYIVGISLYLGLNKMVPTSNKNVPEMSIAIVSKWFFAKKSPWIVPRNSPNRGPKNYGKTPQFYVEKWGYLVNALFFRGQSPFQRCHRSHRCHRFFRREAARRPPPQPTAPWWVLSCEGSPGVRWVLLRLEWWFNRLHAIYGNIYHQFIPNGTIYPLWTIINHC